jgi:hypothetical protein
LSILPVRTHQAKVFVTSSSMAATSSSKACAVDSRITVSNVPSEEHNIDSLEPFPQTHCTVNAENLPAGIIPPASAMSCYRACCSEDVEDEEEDLIAICGVRWRKKDQPLVLLEEIHDSLVMPSHESNSVHQTNDERMGDDETDAESDEDEPEGDNVEKGDNVEEGIQDHQRDFSFELRKAPTVEEAQKALEDLRMLLRPPRGTKQRGYEDPKLSPVLKERLTHMKNFLWLYVDVCDDGRQHPGNPVGGHWGKAADQAARNAHAGKKIGYYLSRRLRSWSKAYIEDRNALPVQALRRTPSRIDDESLAADLKLHLQSLGKYIRAQDIVDYINVVENRNRLGLKKTISLRTAQ